MACSSTDRQKCGMGLNRTRNVQCFGWKESMFICQPENQSVPQESKIWKLKASLQLAMASIRLEQESNQQWGCQLVVLMLFAFHVPS